MIAVFIFHTHESNPLESTRLKFYNHKNPEGLKTQEDYEQSVGQL